MASQSNSYIMSLPLNDQHRYVGRMKEIVVDESPFSLYVHQSGPTTPRNGQRYHILTNTTTSVNPRVTYF